MSRTKYDVWVKPVSEGSSLYKVRFTNESSMEIVKQAGIAKGIYRPGIVIFRLNEWHSLPSELFNFIQYTIIDLGNVKVEYAENSHFEHGI